MITQSIPCCVINKLRRSGTSFALERQGSDDTDVALTDLGHIDLCCAAGAN